MGLAVNATWYSQLRKEEKQSLQGLEASSRPSWKGQSMLQDGEAGSLLALLRSAQLLTIWAGELCDGSQA